MAYALRAASCVEGEVASAWFGGSCLGVDEHGETVEEQLQAELEEGIEVETEIEAGLGGDAGQRREPSRRQDRGQRLTLRFHPFVAGDPRVLLRLDLRLQVDGNCLDVA